jgi:hypothetical protein
MNRLPTFLLLLVLSACASQSGARFDSPEHAVDRLVSATRTENLTELEKILGSGSHDLIYSGDEVADRNGRTKFIAAYDAKHSLEKGADGRYTLYVGEAEWPLPIPLVPDGKEWRWDAAAGREEMLNRRIGRDELNAIQVCLAMCDAQRDYVRVDRDGDGILEYAQKFRSSPGKRDGLFWPAAEAEPQSPLGELAARAALENYRAAEEGEGPRPYHGYHYRILTGQGEHASGGAYSYLAGDRMIGGFAIVAFPANYGVSGIMSFTVSFEGTVYQKDLGPQTAKLATEIRLFDPDSTWTPVEE